MQSKKFDLTSGRLITIFDTTLRDGEQAIGNALNPSQKLQLALELESLGIDYIETGFPASSDADFKSTELIASHLTSAKYVSFCRALKSDIETAIKAGGTNKNHGIQILATGSDLHLEYKRRISREQAIQEVVESIDFAISNGIDSISVGIEDASRSDEQFLQCLINKAIHAGASNFVIADTVGYSIPDQYAKLIRKVRTWAPHPIKISTHCHDDLGFALANSIAGLQAGADEVQVTLGGIGERAGNTALEETAALIFYKEKELNMRSNICLAKMYSTYLSLCGMMGLEKPINKAIFGKYAFSTGSGIHQHGILQNPETYEFVDPAIFGRKRGLFLTRHSGKAIFRYLCKKNNYPITEAKLEEFYQCSIKNQDAQYQEIDDIDMEKYIQFTCMSMNNNIALDNSGYEK